MEENETFLGGFIRGKPEINENNDDWQTNIHKCAISCGISVDPLQ